MASTQMFGRIKGCFRLWLIARPPPYLGKDKWNLKTVNLKTAQYIVQKTLVSVIFQKKVYPKNSEQNCSRHTMDNSSSLHSNKTLLQQNIIDNKTQYENLDQQDQQELQTRTKIENAVYENDQCCTGIEPWKIGFFKDKETCFQFFMNEKL